MRKVRQLNLNKREVGGGYEKAAADFLISQGYEIREMNFRCRMGEIDIIAQDGDYLVFVEVKYRKNRQHGGPLPAVNWKKQRTISRVAMFYLMKHGYSQSTPCRFDVIGILPEGIQLVKNAFDFCAW